MTEFHSSKILNDVNFTEIRSLYKSMGASDEDLSRPIIGIANAWSELVTGHYNLRQLAEFVKKGIYRAGGTAVEFGVIGACDGLASGHLGMKYILPSRDLIANDIETMARAHNLDGIVMLGSCDKIIPGMLMAAARIDIPSIIAVGGPMLGGAIFDGRKSDSTSMTEAVGMLKTGKITMEELKELENVSCPCNGSCSFFGTANSMGALSEAMGMSLSGSALIPAVYAERFRSAEATGGAIVKLVRDKITSRDIITRHAIENAIIVMLATGASTNCVIHLCAIAHEAGLCTKETFDMIDRYSEKIPLVAKINPASQYDMEAFYKAGGIPQVMTELRSYLNLDALTVNDSSVETNLKNYRGAYPQDREIIKPASAPFSHEKGLCILHGNLAPDGAVAKPSAMAPQMFHFSGPAIVFNSEEEANDAIISGKVKAGHVIVVRYEGPKGGPGMREMFHAMKLLYGMGLATSVAVITDGRFSGTNNGCYVGHISPEAAENGPIAAIQNEDIITIDIQSKNISVNIDEEELKRRINLLTPHENTIPDGWLRIYAKLATSASDGAIIR